MMYNDFVFDNCSCELKAGCEKLKDKIFSNPCRELDSVYPIHQLAFDNDWRTFIDFYGLNKSNINSQDELGNTPMILASMMGYKDIITILVFLNADVSIKNNEGWSAIQESISYRNIEIVEMLMKLYKIQDHRRTLATNKAKSINQSKREFILEFTWEVKTWVPIISKYLPSDSCKLTKSGSKLRFDSTLVDFSDQKWCRGNLSCIINPNISTDENPNQIFILNNDRKIYQVLHEFDEKDLKKEIFFLVTSDIVDPNLDLSNVVYSPKSRFWWFGQEPSKEKIGDFEAKMYEMNNVKISMRRRREHISKEQIASNKSIRNTFQRGKLDTLQTVDLKFSDLEPPASSLVTWEQYRSAMTSSTSIVLGRQPVIKNSVKMMNFSIGMSHEFPLEINEIIDVLERFVPIKKIERLRDICSTNLPPGFPVTIDIPIFPTVSANISFLNAQIGNSNFKIDEKLFLIPDDYTMVHDISSTKHRL